MARGQNPPRRRGLAAGLAAPKAREPGRWWFVNRDRRCELCLEDPGFEVDLYLACSLVTMIYTVRGDLDLERAIESGRLEVIGAAKARRALRAWLNLSPLAAIRSQRADAEAA